MSAGSGADPTRAPTPPTGSSPGELSGARPGGDASPRAMAMLPVKIDAGPWPRYVPYIIMIIIIIGLMH